jgi:NAD(P)-dependent dehydrogenase (short-subunit alcohol dehydrogenase family)
MVDNSSSRRVALQQMVAMAGAAGALAGLAGRAQAAAPAVPVTGATPAASSESQPPPLAEVAGKVAYVTGGSSGIGLGLVRVLHAAGMKVVMGFIDDKQQDDAMTFFKAGEPNIHAIKHDVLDADAWERTADEIDRHFGKLHLLINNAGVGVNAAASTGTIKDWQWGLGVNLWGPIHGVHTFVPRMRAHGEGSHIVTTASLGGLIPGSGAGVYAVSKAAAIMLMEELRIELASTNIGTSAFIPGGVSTNLRNSESYRPESLRNGATTETARPAGGPTPQTGPLPPGLMDPMDAARIVLDGIRHNDLFIMSHPEFRPGAETRFNAVLESMITDRPPPPNWNPAAANRTPIYAQEVAHRRATRTRKL